MSFNFKTFVDDLRPYSRELADKIMEPDGVHKHQPNSKYAGWVCKCGSGSGADGTGITEKNGLFSCWACGWQGDILDIIGDHYKITSAMQRAEKAAELAGIDLNRYSDGATKQKSTPKKEEPKPESQLDFILKAAAKIEETDYHRGISLETLKRYKVGFIPDYKHTVKSKPAPALIIPTSKYSYVARMIDKGTKEDYKYLAKGAKHLFNSKALYNTTKPVIFITEGEIDALSIIDAGGEAIALGGVAQYSLLVKEIERQGPPAAPLALLLDNDEPGREAANKLEPELERLKVKYYREGVTLYPEDIKDANDALSTDREGLEINIKAMERVPAAEQRAEAIEYRKEYSTEAATYDFISKVITEYEPPIKTGWESLDTILDGGLYPGLYFIGALSSMGKTTFVLQMADQIAESGHDTLIISLEQSKDELMAKTISRYTYLNSMGGYEYPTNYAKTTRGILDGGRYKNYNKTERGIIDRAIKEYREKTAPHLFVIEGRGNIGTDEIREAVDRHTKLTGKAPVVFIDYLQILKPADMRSTDKQNIDKAVGDLYRIARDYKTQVVAISSFNRDSYNSDASMSSYKESGSIEYSGDFAIAIQPSGLKEGTSKDDIKANKKLVKKTKAAGARTMEAVILKNRNGPTEIKCSFKYITLFNYFEPCEHKTTADDSSIKTEYTFS